MLSKFEWLVVLGGNPLNAGYRTVADRIGAKLAVVDWNEKIGFGCDRHIRADIKDAEAVQSALCELPGKTRFAYTSADVATEVVARINAGLGLCSPPVAALIAARNKASMNEIWEKAGLLNKRYVVCNSADDVRQFCSSVEVASIVKPIDSSSSRGITVLQRHQFANCDWGKVFERAARESFHPQVIVEEFASGTEFTVEMIADSYGAVEVWGISKKYHTPHTSSNRIAVKLHYNPPDVANAELDRIGQFASICTKAIGLRSSLVHMELIVNANKIVPVELAARSSGYIGSHLVSMLHGEIGSYLERYEHMLKGNGLKSEILHSNLSSMYFFYDPPPGRWINEMRLTSVLPRSIQSVAADTSGMSPGKEVRPIDSDNERVGFEVLVGQRRELRIERVVEAELSFYRNALAVGQ